MNKLFSVIIPTYNCEDYLNEGLDSVLNQLPDIGELVVVDDGSTDRTCEILRSYEDKGNANLRVIYDVHKGASGARNTGIENAEGKYIIFIDCDDRMKDGFLSKSIPLLSKDYDLYIFCIERISLNGISEVWSVTDNTFTSISDFADQYVRTRNLLIYSNCNKFYKKDIIYSLNIRFIEGMEFGEDRLFNYEYLNGASNVITSENISIEYVERSKDSQSSRHVDSYFAKALELHRKKTECFLMLSKGTTEEERNAFVKSDLESEIDKAIKRFAEHPEEEAENMPLINKISNME